MIWELREVSELQEVKKRAGCPLVSYSKGIFRKVEMNSLIIVISNFGFVHN